MWLRWDTYPIASASHGSALSVLMKWYEQPLHTLTHEQWEALCDGCGQCCLNQLQDEEDNLYSTDVACRLLDTTTARCTDYSHRSQRVPACVTLTPENLEQVYFMPASCAYRLRAEGQPLPHWHPLRHNGSQNAMQEAGYHVAGHCVSETALEEPLEARIMTWPLG